MVLLDPLWYRQCNLCHDFEDSLVVLFRIQSNRPPPLIALYIFWNYYSFFSWNDCLF